MRVLIVSKPVVPPFHDGTKCLVRDLVKHFEQTEVTVMTTPGAPALLPERHPRRAALEELPIYGQAGGFSPALQDNLRAALFLLLRARATLWHFVFAPNARTSAVGRTLSRLRRVPVVQTIASQPRSFEGIQGLLFGQHVVAQSEWTAGRLREAWGAAGLPEARRPRLHVIPPLVAALEPPGLEPQRRLRRELALPDDAQLFVYPGDLETSRGAQLVAEAVAPLLTQLPRAHVVFAYREKTPAARELAEGLRQRFSGQRVRVVKELSNVLELIVQAEAVLLPVDDLYGKVDLPIVALEAMALGVPVVALNQGPLAELQGAVRLPPDARALVASCVALAGHGSERAAVIAAQRAAVTERYAAPVVARAYERVYAEAHGVR